MSSSESFYGAYQDPDGNNRGVVDGTLVLDLCGWDTHALSTLVLAIMAEEVVCINCIYEGQSNKCLIDPVTRFVLNVVRAERI